MSNDRIATETYADTKATAAISAAATDATTKANAAQAAAIAASVPTSRTITAGTGLTGGGDLSANRTLAPDFGSGTGKVTQGDDSRLSDARTPTAHKTSHQSGGSDAIKLDDLSAPDDNTDLNASASAHGLLPKWPNNATTFLRGDGTYATPTASVTRATLGLDTTDSPQFAGVNVGAATDTTITRTGAGDIAVEGNGVYRAGGTDVPVADGGTGASTAAGAATNLGLGTGDSPQFTAVNVGHATDTTLARSSAGVLSVEGALIDAWTTVRKASDESVASSTTLQADDELLFTALSTVAYEVEVVILYNSPVGAGTPDMKIAFGEDSTARGSMLGMTLSGSDAAANGIALTNQTATFVLGTATANRSAKFTGVHTGAGGTFGVRWAQNTSGVDATTVKAGSVIRYRAIS